MNQQLSWRKEGHLPPQDVGAADCPEGPEEDSGSRSNKELVKEADTESEQHAVHHPLQKVILLHWLVAEIIKY